MAYTEEDLKRAKNILQNHSSCSTDELLEALKIFNYFKSKEERVSMFAVLYERGKSKMDSAQTEKDFQETAEIFSNILAHENANELWKECQNQMEKARIYEDAKRKKDSAQTAFEFLKVAGVFARISDFLDAKELRYDCLNKIEYLRKRGIFDDAIKIFGPAYTAADIEELAKALELFESIKDFPDAHGYVDKIKQCIYETAEEKMKVASTEDDWKKAADIFDKIKGFNEADSLKKDCLTKAEKERKEAIYNKAQKMIDSANTEDGFKKIASIFAEIPGFRNADDLMKECLNRAEDARKQTIYDEAKDKMTFAESEKDYQEAANIFGKIPDFSDAKDLRQKCLEIKISLHYREAINIFESADKKDVDELVESLEIFKSIKDFLNSKEYINQIQQCIYEQAFEQMRLKEWEEAAELFGFIKEYSKAKNLYETCLKNIPQSMKIIDSVVYVNEIKKHLSNVWRLPTTNELKSLCNANVPGIPGGVYWALSNTYKVEKSPWDNTFSMSSKPNMAFEGDVIKFPGGEYFKSDSNYPRKLLLLRRDL